MLRLQGNKRNIIMQRQSRPKVKQWDKFKKFSVQKQDISRQSVFSMKLLKQKNKSKQIDLKNQMINVFQNTIQATMQKIHLKFINKQKRFPQFFMDHPIYTHKQIITELAQLTKVFKTLLQDFQTNVNNFMAQMETLIKEKATEFQNSFTQNIQQINKQAINSTYNTSADYKTPTLTRQTKKLQLDLSFMKSHEQQFPKEMKAPQNCGKRFYRQGIKTQRSSSSKSSSMGKKDWVNFQFIKYNRNISQRNNTLMNK